MSSPRFEQLLAAARSEFDFILVDTPPLLAVSDPCIVSPRTDGLLLVVRTHKNSSVALRQVNQLIQQHGITLFGIVINAMQHSAGEYSSYSGNYAASLQPSRPAMTLRTLVTV